MTVFTGPKSHFVSLKCGNWLPVDQSGPPLKFCYQNIKCRSTRRGVIIRDFAFDRSIFLKNGSFDGPRTPLPFAQIGNWEFLKVMFALYTFLCRSQHCKIPDASLVIWLILHLVPWYRNIWHHFLTQNRSCSGTFFDFRQKPWSSGTI